MYEYVKRMRRTLHSMPELSDEEHRTSDFLFRELTSLGYEPKRIHTGLYVDVEGTLGKKTVALRCDMDGLPRFRGEKEYARVRARRAYGDSSRRG